MREVYGSLRGAVTIFTALGVSKALSPDAFVGEEGRVRG
jgi:hypothetical protein